MSEIVITCGHERHMHRAVDVCAHTLYVFDLEFVPAHVFDRFIGFVCAAPDAVFVYVQVGTRNIVLVSTFMLIAGDNRPEKIECDDACNGLCRVIMRKGRGGRESKCAIVAGITNGGVSSGKRGAL